ncbi:Uu.00g034560.m01.CDS01 [Anthostomella pinea]|uniref:Uu.00g034560.m01.CDS01 n=1 Tax=Anthostomella pinea TaxID=933095 RepID=A0AAI8V463_9PEZI|nr:Uu.00g034560.m01.CDS01 [Anthostomella pinea]
MIRHPLYSAVGRTRADLTRVTDGIAASLRHFSAAQRRSAPPPPDSSNGNNDDGSSSTSNNSGSRRQRAAAAFDELMSINNDAQPSQSSQPSRQQPTSSNEFSRSASLGNNDFHSSSSRPNMNQPNLISVPRGGMGGSMGMGNGFRGGNNNNGGGGFRGGYDNGGSGFRGGSNNSSGGPSIIRGGFRGRGRGSFAGRGGPGGASRGRGRGRGGGGMGPGRDDRPQRRGRGRGRGGGEDGGARGRKKTEDEEHEADMDYVAPDVQAYLESKDIGTPMAFDPSVSLASLTGYGPALPTSNTGTSAFAASETVVRQARILGGGQAYHPTHLLHPHDIRAAYASADGPGIFFPTQNPTEACEWTQRAIRNKDIANPVPDETKKAVLEDALLGRYDGPKFAEDPTGIVRSYVKRDGTWNADAERRIEAKVRSLLPGGGVAKAGGARPKA